MANFENVDAPDSDYPGGRVRDDDGTGNGTWAEEATLGDIWQFFYKMFDYSGLTYNEQPDNDYSGFQFWQALILNIRNTAATEDLAGTLEIATTAEFEAASATDKIVPPAKFGEWTDYELVAGSLIKQASTALANVAGHFVYKKIGKALHYNFQMVGEMNSAGIENVEFLLPAGVRVKVTSPAYPRGIGCGSVENFSTPAVAPIVSYAQDNDRIVFRKPDDYSNGETYIWRGSGSFECE